MFPPVQPVDFLVDVFRFLRFSIHTDHHSSLHLSSTSLSMGRSQVLYNRTKGRYRSRHGVPGRGGSAEREATTTTYIEPDNLPPTQALPLISSSKSRRPKVDESILLAEPTTNYTSQSQTIPVDEDSLFAQGGMIDIASMAATLTSSMSLAQRLRIPSHVAYQLQYPNAMLDSNKVKPNKEMPAIEPQDAGRDDASYSVAHTRIRVGADGQVEARPKPGLYNPLSMTESVDHDEHMEHPTNATSQNRSLKLPAQLSESIQETEVEESTEDPSDVRLSTFDESLDPDSRCIRHGNDLIDDEEEDDEDEDNQRDRYLAIIDSNTEEEEDDLFDEPASAQPHPAAAVIGNWYETGYSSMSVQRELHSDKPVSPFQRSRERVSAPSTKDRSVTRPPKIDTSLGNFNRPSITTPTARTPKHANVGPFARPPHTEGEETESYLEGWLDEAMKSNDAVLPVHHIPVDPIDAIQDDCSSITDLPHHGGSSVSTLTVSKAGTRTTGTMPYQTRHLLYSSKYAEETLSRPYEDEDRRLRTHEHINTPAIITSASTMDSRGQVYDDDGSVQPRRRKHEPSPNGKKRSSSSKKKNEREGGEDLDAWLDSVIS